MSECTEAKIVELGNFGWLGIMSSKRVLIGRESRSLGKNMAFSNPSLAFKQSVCTLVHVN